MVWRNVGGICERKILFRIKKKRIKPNLRARDRGLRKQSDHSLFMTANARDQGQYSVHSTNILVLISFPLGQWEQRAGGPDQFSWNGGCTSQVPSLTLVEEAGMAGTQATAVAGNDLEEVHQWRRHKASHASSRCPLLSRLSTVQFSPKILHPIPSNIKTHTWSIKYRIKK